MPEPEWNRLGGVDETSIAYFNKKDCGWRSCEDNVVEIGRIDLFGEVYRSTSNEDYYASVQNVTQYPGVDYSGGESFENQSTRMVHDWLGSDDIIDIREWGPTEPKTSSLDWSGGVSAGTGGAGAPVSASYNVPYIERDTAVDIGDHIRGNQYYYPLTASPFDEEAKKNVVSLENISSAIRERESCSSPYCNFQNIVKFDIEAEFYDSPGAIVPTDIDENFMVKY